MRTFIKYYSPDEVIGVSLQADASQGVQSVGSFRKQLRDAAVDVVLMNEKFGATSKEAIAAAQKVAKLKDAIGDAKNLSEAFNPDRKFQAFSNSIRAVTGGFAAAQGAMALFGSESEDVQKQLLKVQGALALTEGLNSILEAKDTFKSLGAVISNTAAFQKLYNASTAIASVVTRAFGISVAETGTAFKVLRGAIISTGIGALVVLIGLAIGKISEWVSSTDNAEKAQERLKNAVDELNDSLNDQQSALKRAQQLAEAKAKADGKSEGDILKIRQTYAGKNKEVLGQTLRDKFDQLEKFKKYRHDDEKSEEAYQSALKDYNQTYSQYKDSETQQEVERYNEISYLREEGEKKEKEYSEKEKQRRQKQAEEAKAQMERNRQAAMELSKLRQDNIANEIVDEDKRNRALIVAEEQAEQYRINQLKISEGLRRQLLSETRVKFGEKLIEFDNKAADEFKQKQEERLKSIEQAAAASVAATTEHINSLTATKDQQKKLEIEIGLTGDFESRKQAELDQLNQTYAEKYRLAQGNAELIKQLDEKYGRESADIATKYANIKLESYKAIGDAANALGELLGKQTAAGKALGVASAIINTWVGVTEVLRNKTVLPEPLGTINKIASITGVVAAGFGAVKNILKTNVPGGGGSGGGVGASVSAPIAPPVQTSTNIDQDSINGINAANPNKQQFVQAVVTDSNMRNQQETWKLINQQKRIR